MKKTLITGISGQDGSYLAELLLEKEYEVHGIIRKDSPNGFQNIDNIKNYLNIHYGNIANSSFIHNLIREIKPDEIYNLAAISDVPSSHRSFEYTTEINALTVTKILQTIKEESPLTRFYQASSSELYGITNISPQSESTSFSPLSPYAIAKLYAYWTVIYFRNTFNLHASNGITFNHDSPRRRSVFVTKKITEYIGEYVEGYREKPLQLGNLNSKRDWGYAKDYVIAMFLMLQEEKPDDYIIATGKQHTIREFCDNSFEKVGIILKWEGEGLNETGKNAKTGETIIVINPELFRPYDVDNIVGDFTKLNKKTNWLPSTKFKDLIHIMIDHENNRRKSKL